MDYFLCGISVNVEKIKELYKNSGEQLLLTTLPFNKGVNNRSPGFGEIITVIAPSSHGEQPALTHLICQMA